MLNGYRTGSADGDVQAPNRWRYEMTINGFASVNDYEGGRLPAESSGLPLAVDAMGGVRRASATQVVIVGRFGRESRTPAAPLRGRVRRFLTPALRCPG
jgi:hypothetical protein